MVQAVRFLKATALAVDGLLRDQVGWVAAAAPLPAAVRRVVSYGYSVRSALAGCTPSLECRTGLRGVPPGTPRTLVLVVQNKVAVCAELSTRLLELITQHMCEYQ